jgi:hypothetical protein
MKQENHKFQASPGKVSETLHQKQKNTNKMAERCGSMGTALA